MASLTRAKIDAKNKGHQYVQDKYGMSFYNKYQSQLQRATGSAPGRSKAYNQQSIKTLLQSPPDTMTMREFDLDLKMVVRHLRKQT